MSALHLKERESVPPPPPTTNTKRHIYTDSYTQTPTHTQTAVHTDTHRQTEAETSHLEGQQLEWSCGTQTQDDQKPIHARAAWQKEYESEPLLERQSERTSNRVHRPVHTSNTKHTKHTATPQTHTDRHTKHTKHTKHKTRTQTQTHTHHRQTHTQTDTQTDRHTHTHTQVLTRMPQGLQSGVSPSTVPRLHAMFPADSSSRHVRSRALESIPRDAM